MIIPPFNMVAEDDAEFRCLAFTAVNYLHADRPETSAALGVYFCSHEGYTRFSRRCVAADGHTYFFTSGDNKHDTLQFHLLSSLLDESVHPAAWRLFPRVRIPDCFNSDEYEEVRRELCLLLNHFRNGEEADRLTADMPQRPLMVFDESVGRMAMGDSREEDEEICRAVMDELD